MKLIEKHDGIIKKMELTSDNKNESCGKIKHLCAEHCMFAFVDKCPKIADNCKKTIDKYDFITDGFQEIKNNGEIKRFCVTGCDKYRKKAIKETKEMKERRNKLVASNYTLRYPEPTVEDARLREWEDRENGTLKGDIFIDELPLINIMKRKNDGEARLVAILRNKMRNQKNAQYTSQSAKKYQLAVMIAMRKAIKELSEKRNADKKALEAKIATYTKYSTRIK